MRKMTSDEIKAVGTEILGYVDNVCNSCDIPYFISFGTLLGAIRHQGYIPWDDDIDICMRRKDYERFEELMIADSRYRFISFKNDPDYYFPFARVSDKNTVLKLRSMREIHDLGVFVDVFPLDVAPPADQRAVWLKTYRYLKRKMEVTVPSTARYADNSWFTLLRRLRRFPERLRYKSRDFERHRRELQEWIIQYDCEESDELISCETYDKIQKTFHVDLIEETLRVPFEGMSVNAPRGYDELLKAFYGNYMQLPPAEQQRSHHHFTAYWRD